MIRNKNWTKEEDQILIDQIRNGGHKNVLEAIEQVSIIVGRAKSATAVRWYKKVSKRPEVVYACGSAKGMLVNHKVVSRKNGEMRQHTMKPMLYVISEMLKLSPQEQKIILDLFK